MKLLTKLTACAALLSVMALTASQPANAEWTKEYVCESDGSDHIVYGPGYHSHYSGSSHSSWPGDCDPHTSFVPQPE